MLQSESLFIVIIYKHLANSFDLAAYIARGLLKIQSALAGFSLMVYYLSQHLKNEGLFLFPLAVFGRDPEDLFNI